MRKGLLTKSLAAAVLVAFTTGMVIQDDLYLSPGSEAPDFEVKATDGESYSLKNLTEKAPVFLVFWKDPCGHNPRATPLFNRIKEAYGDKVTLLGVVNLEVDGASGWAERFGFKYPVLEDGDRELIGAYEVVKSVCTFQIGTDGKITKVFEGYGRDEITSLNKALAEVAGVDATEIDMAGAPQRQTWG